MSPIDIQDFLERAKAAARIGDHEEAERLLKNYLAKVPGSRDAHLLMGTVLAGMGRLEDAADEFNTLAIRNPQDIEALNNQAVMYHRLGRHEEALALLIQAVDFEPSRSEFHYNIGNVHKDLGNRRAASMAYAKVLELDPSYVPAYNNLGTVYDELKEHDRALNIFRKGLTVDQNNPTLHYNYGLALESRGRLEDAAAQYQASLRSKPGWLKPMNSLGVVCLKLGLENKAEDVFKRILDMEPSSAEAWYYMGLIRTNQGRAADGIKAFRKAMECNPLHGAAAAALGRLLEDRGEWRAAITELEKALDLDPGNGEIRNRLARLQAKTGNYAEARNQAKAALDLNGNDIQALRVYGALERFSGNDGEAQKAFDKITALDPGNNLFYLDTADLYFQNQQYDEAEKQLQAYLDRDKASRNARLLLGRLYAAKGEKDKAIRVFEDLAAEDPSDTEALGAAAELHRETGSYEKALRTADTLVNVQGNRASANDLSELNKSLEFYETAVDAYASAVKEMWDRNIRLAAGGEKDIAGGDFSLLLDSGKLQPELVAEDILLKNDASPGEEEVELLAEDFEESLASNETREEPAPLTYEPEPPAPSLRELPADEPFNFFLENLPGVTGPLESDDAPITDGFLPQTKEPPAQAPKAEVPKEEKAPDSTAQAIPRKASPADEPEAVPESAVLFDKESPLKPEAVLENQASEAVLVEETGLSGQAEEPNVPKEPLPKPYSPPGAFAVLCQTRALLNYLKNLVAYLPEKEQAVFFRSEVRLSIEHAIGELEGRSGVLDEG